VRPTVLDSHRGRAANTPAPTAQKRHRRGGRADMTVGREWGTGRMGVNSWAGGGEVSGGRGGFICALISGISGEKKET